MKVGTWKEGATKKSRSFAFWPIKCDDGTTRWLEKVEITYEWICGVKGFWTLRSVSPVE